MTGKTPFLENGLDVLKVAGGFFPVGVSESVKKSKLPRMLTQKDFFTRFFSQGIGIACLVTRLIGTPRFTGSSDVAGVVAP